MNVFKFSIKKYRLLNYFFVEKLVTLLTFFVIFFGAIVPFSSVNARSCETTIIETTASRIEKNRKKLEEYFSSLHKRYISEGKTNEEIWMVIEIMDHLLNLKSFYHSKDVQKRVLSEIEGIEKYKYPKIEYLKHILGILSPTKKSHSGKNGDVGELRGSEVLIEESMPRSEIESLYKENVAAKILARIGFDVIHMGREKGKGIYSKLLKRLQKQEGLSLEKNPDLIIEDHVFDVYSPTAGEVSWIVNRLKGKVSGVVKSFGHDNGKRRVVGVQTKRVVLNIMNNQVLSGKLSEIRQALYSLEKSVLLEEVIVLYSKPDGPHWTRLYP